VKKTEIAHRHCMHASPHVKLVFELQRSGRFLAVQGICTGEEGATPCQSAVSAAMAKVQKPALNI
jgi:hypothetical protein